MNRRSFLQFLGLAPIAPTVLAAVPSATTGLFPEPFLPPATLLCGEFARREIERITGIDRAPTLGEWLGEMERAQDRLANGPDRIPAALRT